MSPRDLGIKFVAQRNAVAFLRSLNKLSRADLAHQDHVRVEVAYALARQARAEIDAIIIGANEALRDRIQAIVQRGYMAPGVKDPSGRPSHWPEPSDTAFPVAPEPPR